MTELQTSGNGPRWRPYPAYKDSGVDWLGKIPVHWKIIRLKYIAEVPKIKLMEKPDDLTYLGLEHVESKTGRLTLETPVDEIDSIVAVFERGDILFGKLRPYLAKVYLANFEGTCTTEFLILRANNRVVQKYLFYQIVSEGFINLVNSMTYGAKMPRANYQQIINIYILIPPEEEQSLIISFIDLELKKIDDLVAKKERQIELLQEKRTALISRAVTRGLDPNVPLKDSGIDWLGHIPAHWEVLRLKFLISFVTSGSRGWAQYYSDEGALFLRIGNLSRISLDLNLDEVQFVEPPAGAEVDRTRVGKDDVLISITAYIGSIAVIEKDIGEAYVNQHIALTRPLSLKVKPKWLGYALLSEIGQHQFRILLYGGTKDGLGLDDVKDLFIFLPPPKEQETIVSFLDQETAKIDALITKIRESIERLKEYRTALISAAVTGKIDVRGADIYPKDTENAKE